MCALITYCCYDLRGCRQRGRQLLLLYFSPLLQAPPSLAEVTSRGFKGLTPFFSLFLFGSQILKLLNTTNSREANLQRQLHKEEKLEHRHACPRAQAERRPEKSTNNITYVLLRCTWDISQDRLCSATNSQ